MDKTAVWLDSNDKAFVNVNWSKKIFNIRNGFHVYIKLSIINRKIMKTMNLKLSSQSGSQNYDNNGNVNGSSTSMSFRITVEEDGTEVGNANYTFSINYYNVPEGVDYTSAKEALEAKIKSAITEFNNALKA